MKKTGIRTLLRGLSAVLLAAYVASLVPAMAAETRTSAETAANTDEATPTYTFRLTDEWIASLDKTTVERVSFDKETLGADHYFMVFGALGDGMNYIYLGDYDLSKVSVVSFEVTCGADVSFDKDAHLRFTTAPGGGELLGGSMAQNHVSLTEPKTAYALFDTDYSGPVYLTFYSAGSGGSYRVANINFYASPVGDDAYEFPTEALTTETPTEPATDPVTEPVTDPVTEPVTDPVTEPATTTEEASTGEDDGGCSSALSASAVLIALSAVIALAVFGLRRKEGLS